MKKIIIGITAFVLCFALIAGMYHFFKDDVFEEDESAEKGDIFYEYENSEDKYSFPESENLESAKKEIDPEYAQTEKAYVKNLLEKGKYSDAYEYLYNFFQTYSKEGAASELYRYYVDLSLLIRMSSVLPSEYETVFSGFVGDLTFLSAMIYYPASVKLSAFVMMDSIVPTTESNDVVFYEAEDLDEDILNQMKASFSNFLGGKKIPFSVDGIDCEAILLYDKDYNHKIWTISTEDENSYFMTVSKWTEIIKKI